MCLNILISPNARTLNMVKKIPRQLGQWNPLETCLNMPLVLKKFLGPFLRKCILKNSNLYIENIYTTKNIWRTLGDVKVNSGQLLFSAPN